VTRYRTIVADPPWPIGDFPEWADGRGTVATPYPSMSLDDIEALPVASFAEADAHLYLWTINEHLVRSFRIARRWGFVPSATLVWCKPPRGVGMGGVYASNVEFVLFCRRMGVQGHVVVTSFLADAAESAGKTRADVDQHMGTTDMAGWWLSRLEHRARIPTPEQWDRLKAFLGASDKMDETYFALREAERWQGAKVDTRWWCWPRGKHSAKPEAFLDIVEQVSPGPYLEMFARRNRLGWDTWGNEALQHVDLEAA
jgi:N6-adenosine-specific RNA methylase IME4